MAYVFSAMWFIIGGYLIYNGIKENKLFCYLGSYFLFLGLWWIADEFIQIDLMGGIYVWILRGVSAVALCIAGVIYYRQKKQRSNKN